MAYGSHTENLSPRKFCILVSKRTSFCSVNTSLVTYQISFTRSKCSKQKLTSCAMSIIPNLCKKCIWQRSRLQISSKLWWIMVSHKMLQHNFSLQSNKSFLACCTSTNNDSNFMQLKELENYHNRSLLLKPSQI